MRQSEKPRAFPCVCVCVCVCDLFLGLALPAEQHHIAVRQRLEVMVGQVLVGRQRGPRPDPLVLPVDLLQTAGRTAWRAALAEPRSAREGAAAASHRGASGIQVAAVQ